MNSTKLYVGGLPYSTTETQLQEIFSEHGSVESARVITDRMTGRSRGFGFVEMSSQSEAQTAMEALNGTQLEGRSLTVNEAKPQRPRTGGAGGGGGGGGSGGGLSEQPAAPSPSTKLRQTAGRKPYRDRDFICDVSCLNTSDELPSASGPHPTRSACLVGRLKLTK